VSEYKGRVGIVQRVLPRYRAAFFDLLAERCEKGLGVFAGAARPSEQIPLAEKQEVAQWTRAQNIHLFGGPFYLCVQRGLSKWLNEWQPDVLIVEANPRYVSTKTGVEFMHNRQRPVIAWGLGSPTLQGLLAGQRKQARRRFLSQFDAIIAYSQRGAAEYRSLGFRSERVFVAPNAVVSRPNGQVRLRKEKEGSERTVLFVGRLQERKRVDALIRACAALPNTVQAKLLIVGDGPAKEDLQSLAREIFPNTEFTGHKIGEELSQLFDRADIFVLPGTGGLAIQQAMAQGLPIIAAQGDGSQADLVQPDNGWLIKPNDEHDLQQTLAQALADPKKLHSMGEKSFKRVQNEFNLENMVESFVNAINEVSA
jgi:glycosyltransferase involved in cell wall biosynthesis